MFSAHGVSKAVRAEADARGLRVFDATCPLVTKVHVEVAKMREHGREIVMIGHAGHPEVEGTMGQVEGGMYLVDSVEDVDAASRCAIRDKLAYVTQTTLSVDDAAAIVAALKARFPDDRRAEARRHLLRDAESPGRGEGAGAVGRRGDRRRQPQQLQLEPPARSGGASRRAGLDGRPRGRAAARVGRRHAGASA